MNGLSWCRADTSCRSVCMHPITLAIWGGLSCIFIQYMQWWPHPDYGILGHLLPLPGFASMAVPIMFLVDWCVFPTHAITRF